MPKFLFYLAVIGLSLAIVPPTVVARIRAMNSDKPRIHIIQDMDNQSRFKFQQENPLFNDNRAMRSPIEGTVARGELRADAHFDQGWDNGAWVDGYPDQIVVDDALLRRGQERYEIYCSMCHGQAGYGDGIVHERANELLLNPAISMGTSWVQPKNIHEPEIRIQPTGQLYNTITNGIRTMSGYAAQIPTDDRWAITAYVKALQRSQNAEPTDLQDGDVDDLEKIDLVPRPEGGN